MNVCSTGRSVDLTGYERVDSTGKSVDTKVLNNSTPLTYLKFINKNYYHGTI